MIQQYYEITEHNEWEGETFGYIVKLTPEQVEKIEKRFKEINKEEENDVLELIPHNLTLREVALINKYSSNSYMDRLSYCKIRESVNLDNFEYQEFPYKRNGLELIP